MIRNILGPGKAIKDILSDKLMFLKLLLSQKQCKRYLEQIDMTNKQIVFVRESDEDQIKEDE